MIHYGHTGFNPHEFRTCDFDIHLAELTRNAKLLAKKASQRLKK